jgi:hypothetical protein
MNISRVTAMVALVASAIGTARAQQATFSSRIDAVRVDVLVTDANGPIRGLGPADFEIRDNGVLQQIDLVSFEQIPLNVVLALDMSDSVAGDRLDRLRTAGAAILGGTQVRRSGRPRHVQPCGPARCETVDGHWFGANGPRPCERRWQHVAR